MGKSSKEDKSDGIDIISIGKLYTGPWYKKYWSSSRGKDRYPYPVGYKSLRTQNGVTYTMEIVEGVKGPSFTISSTDGNVCSGGTPDMVWESFQKKACSKLWHAKRFSCKIDGVEFFGFRNTLVQRLLRELVANVGGTTEHSSFPSKLSGDTCVITDQRQCKPSNPDLLTYLVKSSHCKGKRSRNDKVGSSKLLNGNHFKQHKQEECANNATSLIAEQRDQSNCTSRDIPTSDAVYEVSRVYIRPGPENSASKIKKGKCLATAEGGLQLDAMEISDNLKPGGALSTELILTVPINHFELESLDTDNLQQKQEPSDKSKYNELQESDIILPVGDGATNVHDAPVCNGAGLYAPDTFDHAEDSSNVSLLKNDVQVDCILKDAVISDVTKSEVLATDSVPEDEIEISVYKNYETCDTDSAVQDVANSMLALLLPQAIPFLKTFSKRKKKSAKMSKPLTHISQEVNDICSVSMNETTIATGLAEHSDSRRKNEKECIPCVAHDAVVSTAGNSISVVPDSFDNDDPQDLFPHANAVQAGQLLCAPDPHAQLVKNDDEEVNLRNSESSMHDTRTAGATLVAAMDALTPVTEITANSKKDRSNFHSVDSRTSTHLSTMNGTSISDSIVCRSSSDICISEVPCTSGCSQNVNINDHSRSNLQHKSRLNNRTRDCFELFACYAHPTPISMVQLTVKSNEVFICVTCENLKPKEDTLFLYKAQKNGDKMGCPSLIGHAPIDFHISENALGRNIASGRSLLQLIPDGQSLVLLNNIKLPCCREGKLHCSCPACASGSLESNAVKVVRLNWGYASLVTRLKTTQAVCCLLVCGTSFLLAAEEGGKLKLWAMNSGWSGPQEDWYLPTFDCTLPTIIELKTVPRSAVLVVGHNGCGEFGIWDIDKRHLISRFSSPDMAVLECIPVSVFSWQRKGEHNMTSLVREIMDATKMGFTGTSESCIFAQEDKNVAVWLLISTNSSVDSECYQSSEEEANAGICWRLALLVNNMVITGSAVDSGTAAAAAAGHGIIGRRDGQVYAWELSTGNKLGNLHSFDGGRVSCITADASNSGALAIARPAPGLSSSLNNFYQDLLMIDCCN